MDIAEDVKGDEVLKPHEQLAIDFLARNGTDCVGVIDSEEKLAAAWMYVNLHTRGYLIATIGDTGPVYRLTSKGRRASNHLDIVTQLKKACNGHPHAKIPWPHRLLHDAIDEIERLRKLVPSGDDTIASTISSGAATE